MSSASSAITYTYVYTNSEPGRPHDLDFVPEPIYPEYILLEDEHILSAEKQPLPHVVSPTAESPEYVAELDPEEDTKEYEDDEIENGPVDYPMDGGDDGDDDDDDSSRDDADDKDEDEEDKKEEEEHLAPTDSAVVIPLMSLITVRLQAAISFPPEAKVERLLAMPTPSPSLLASLSPPSTGERLARCMAPNASPLPPPPLHIPPPVDRRDDIPENEMPPRKRLCLSTLGSTYKVRESFTARPTGGRGIDYGFVSTLDAEARQRRIGEMVETLRVVGDMRREMGDMQAELLALCEQPRRAGQPGWDARVPNHQEAPRDADRTKGVVGLTRWIKKMESVFQISGCAVENQEVLKKKMTDKYCPQGKIKKLEIELWNLKIKENNVSAYTERFQEQTLICTKFVADETEKIDKYVSGLPDNIYGSEKASKPKTLDETIELANDLMDQKLRTYAERQSNNKRKADDSSKNNHGHQQ
nr:hypothetical protein [Tanacetum cinerariifolium]